MFKVRDRELSTGLPGVIQEHLKPAVIAVCRGVDRALLGHIHKFGTTPATRAGRLNGLTSANIYDSLVEIDQILNQNNAPQDNRYLALSPSAKAIALRCDKLTKACERGDQGQAMRTAQLGDILGFSTYMAQNVPTMLTGGDTASLTVSAAHDANSSAAYGSTGAGAALAQGEWCVVAGNDQPTWVMSKATDAFTLHEASKYATSAGAVATRYKACATAASYSAGWEGTVAVNGYGAAPQRGQLISFGSTPSTRHTYTIIEATVGDTSADLLLDRPLEMDVASAAPAYPGPQGSFNMAFHRDALALVSRPLAHIDDPSVRMAVREAYGVGIRVSMQYNIDDGMKIKLDLLCGIKELNGGLCVPLLG